MQWGLIERALKWEEGNRGKLVMLVNSFRVRSAAGENGLGGRGRVPGHEYVGGMIERSYFVQAETGQSKSAIVELPRLTQRQPASS